VGQIIKRAIRSDMEVDRAENVGGEIIRRIVGRVQHTNPTAADVGEKIFANESTRKLQHRRIVERCADDGAASGAARPVPIEEDRVPEIWIRRGSRTFCDRPAIVRSGNTVINFLPRALTNVVDKHASGSRLKCEREWIAQTDRPNRAVRSGSRAGYSRKRSGIIRRDGAVGIDAENFSQTIAQRLRVGAVSILTDTGVQLAVRSKMDRATIMIRGVAQVVEIDQDELAVSRGDISGCREPTYTIMRRGTMHGVIKVNEMVACEIRIERHAEKPSLAVRIDR